ncbi:potassium-transporting ATPase subunit C, partial [Pseudomonas aeruginosa]|nr:potassium-transporting ATPase subunit C [Pseudomonas aeruginosa]
QALRVATARGLPLRLVEDLVESHTERPLVGPAVVNVLALNMALAGLKR